MKTAELIDGLASAAAPIAPVSPARRLGMVVAAGGVLALAVLLPWLGLRRLGEAIHLPSFWMKSAYTAALAVAAWILAARLARPSGRVLGPLVAALAVPLFMISMGAMQVATTPAANLRHVWLGGSWDRCSIDIVLLAVPVFALGVYAMRRLAPTRLTATGAALGLMAGAAGATVYGLHCDESTAAFTATWYTLGIAACAAIGALVGPRLLRW